MPAASQRLTSHSTWPVSLVRNDTACHPGQPLRTNKNATLNPTARQRPARRAPADRQRAASASAIVTSGNALGMREHKAAATTAGILYITGTVAGVLSLVVSAPVRDAGDPLAAVAGHSGAVVTGALLVLIMGLSLAFVPVVLFPVLRRVDEVLAIGYLIMRGAVETVCYVVLAISWLLLVPLGEAMSAGPGTASPAGLRLGSLVIDSDATNAVLALVFCVGAAMFYFLLYRSHIVPRWIAMWGLAAIPFYVAGDLLAMYGVIGASSSGQVLIFMPLAVQEMVLAAWMIARGFRPAAVPATPELADSTLVGV